MAFFLALAAVLVACTHPVRRLVFQPHKITRVPPVPVHVAHLQRFWLETEQGPVEGWLLPGEGAGATHPGPAVLLAHGNRELIDDYLVQADAYRRLGLTVMLGEYRGYGRSAGRPSRQRIARDYRAFFDRLAALPFVDARRIVFHGRSLGGGVLCDLSRQRRPAALILESTFASIKAMAHGAPDILLSDNYDNIAALQAYAGPVLIIHGTRDTVVPVGHAEALHRARPGAELMLFDGDHSDPFYKRAAYWNAISAFLAASALITPH